MCLNEWVKNDYVVYWGGCMLKFSLEYLIFLFFDWLNGII